MAVLSSIALAALIGCNKAPREPINESYGVTFESGKYGVEEQKANTQSKRVLVVYNKQSELSIRIAGYYAKARKIPKENVIGIDVEPLENVRENDFHIEIKDPILVAIRRSKTPIDFVVLTKGVPMRISTNNGYSVDAAVTAMELDHQPIPLNTQTSTDEEYERAISRNANPYGGATERFSAKKYKMFLTTRLDGYDWEDIKKLIDNSLAAKPNKGPFFFDCATNRQTGGYGQMQSTLVNAHKMLKTKGFDSELDIKDPFVAYPKPMAGYASWGSNDGKFDPVAYSKLRFLPGAICETFVSTSGRTFLPTKGGQSLIADLIKQGVTGVKGYVSEPFTFALARPDVMFDRYTGGFNLAEAIYAASPVIKWKDVVIGDPLCNPYGDD